MNIREYQELQDAYQGVYQQLDEGLGSAIRRIFSGKKEAEAPKPESRGAELRRKYNVGPEGSDTSAKRQILDRSRAKAERDKKEFGSSKYSKSVANQSQAAHDRYLKAGYSKYGADLPVSGGQGGSGGSGRGSKAAKRAAALQREEFEYIVDTLIEEGYDLSSYTWNEMYDICLSEIQQLDEEAPEKITKPTKNPKLMKTGGPARVYNPNKMDEETDVFTQVLEYLVAEGYADTNENALAIMANMSEEWKEDILDEAYQKPKFGRKDYLKKLSKRGGMGMGTPEDPHGYRDPKMAKVGAEFSKRKTSEMKAKKTEQPDSYRAEKESQSKNR